MAAILPNIQDIVRQAMEIHNSGKSTREADSPSEYHLGQFHFLVDEQGKLSPKWVDPPLPSPWR
jgi:hypothetical protein